MRVRAEGVDNNFTIQRLLLPLASVIGHFTRGLLLFCVRRFFRPYPVFA